MKDTLQRAWTVFFLVRAIDSSFIQAKQMIEELKQTEIGDELGVILCLNIRKNLIEEIDPSYREACNRLESGLTTVFYQLEKSPLNNGNNKNMLRFIDEKNDFDLREKDDIGNFFRNAIIGHCNCYAKKYALFTWDHGGPFGIFIDSNNRGLRAAPEGENAFTDGSKKLVVVSNAPSTANRLIHFRQFNFIKNAPAAQCGTRALKRIFAEPEESEPDPQMLTMTELKCAIGYAFGKRKLDLLVMMNCFTNFFDTGYELRDNVRYLVAPETLIYFNGYNYGSIFRLLSDEPDTSASKLSRHVVSSFYEKNNYPDKATEEISKSSVAFFASALIHYAEMATIINDIAQKLSEQLPGAFKKIRVVRNSFEIINNSELYHIIDFHTFITFLKAHLFPLNDETIYTRYESARKLINVAGYIGSQFKKERPGSITGPSGFSIYFPKTTGQFNLLFRRLFQMEGVDLATLFTKEFAWDNFLDTYFELLDKAGQDD